MNLILPINLDYRSCLEPLVLKSNLFKPLKQLKNKLPLPQTVAAVAVIAAAFFYRMHIQLITAIATGFWLARVVIYDKNIYNSHEFKKWKENLLSKITVSTEMRALSFVASAAMYFQFMPIGNTQLLGLGLAFCTGLHYGLVIEFENANKNRETREKDPLMSSSKTTKRLH